MPRFSRVSAVDRFGWEEDDDNDRVVSPLVDRVELQRSQSGATSHDTGVASPSNVSAAPATEISPFGKPDFEK